MTTGHAIAAQHVHGCYALTASSLTDEIYEERSEGRRRETGGGCSAAMGRRFFSPACGLPPPAWGSAASDERAVTRAGQRRF